MSAKAVGLLLGLLLVHFLGDFSPLVTDRVLETKAQGGPMGPIAGHAALHGVLVGAAAAVIARPGWLVLAAVVALEFVSHFLVDAGRARLGVRVPATGDPARDAFWYVFGVDQFVHLVVLVGLAALLV